MYEKILKHPDERLTTPARPVDEAFCQSGDIVRLIGALKTHLAQCDDGIGLAANQIGGDRRVIVISIPGHEGTEEYTMVNPEITKRRGERLSDEQCLSIEPRRTFVVVRPKAITVQFQEPMAADDGMLWFRDSKIKASGLLAACLCHEIDHLDGITLVEREEMQQCRAS